MVKGHDLQLRSHPLLFHNFKWFNIKAAAAHHPIIQKEMDELLANGVIEPSSDGAGFYSSVFVVPKHAGSLWPILNLKQFNSYLHMPSFKMPAIRHVWQTNSILWLCFLHWSQGCLFTYFYRWASSLIYDLFHKIFCISGKFCLLCWPQPLRFSQLSLNLSCSFAITGFTIWLSIQMISCPDLL